MINGLVTADADHSWSRPERDAPDTDGGVQVTLDGLQRRLRSTPTPEIVVVGGEAAVGVATYLDGDCTVVFVSGDGDVVARATARGLDARRTDVADGGRLSDHTVGADAAVVATERDRLNLLVAQLLRTVCGVDDVTVRVNDPDNRDVFEEVGVTVVDGGSLVATEVADALFDRDG